MSKTLEEIRQEIDAIDNQVHDLLMARAALVHSVASAKKKEGLQIVQPAREARMVRRLLSRHSGPLPQATVVRIWRELVGAVALLQTGLSVAVAAVENGSGIAGSNIYWDMAKNYFGSVVPMKKINGSANAISALREDKCSFAVLPWPELEEKAPWWVHLFGQRGDERISIICALPYGAEKQDSSGIKERALVLSKIAFMPSDDDISFIGLEVSADVSRAAIIDKVHGAGLKILNFYSTPITHHEGFNLHFIEVKGYLTEESEALLDLGTALGDVCEYCAVLGGYPAMQELERTKIG